MTMTQQEFTQRTGFYPTAEQFQAIHAAYMDSDKDKDTWCKEWKRNGGVEEYSKATAVEIATLHNDIKTTKAVLNEQIREAYKLANEWNSEYREARKQVEELEAELKKWKGIVDAIRMSIPKE